MWTIAQFQPTTLFSLRPANATTSGGKTLVTPTPFALKMALLDAAIRVYGLTQGEKWFPTLRDLQVAVQLPAHLVVINTFIKILRPHKSGPKDLYGTGLLGQFGNTIAYRELVHFGGAIHIALKNTAVPNTPPPLPHLLTHIHYLGKRGGFMQCQQIKTTATLPPEFTPLNPETPPTQFHLHGLLQLLDDCGHKMNFNHANVYHNKSLSIGKSNGRILNPIILPYRLAQSSRSYTLYERINHGI